MVLTPSFLGVTSSCSDLVTRYSSHVTKMRALYLSVFEQPVNRLFLSILLRCNNIDNPGGKDHNPRRDKRPEQRHAKIGSTSLRLFVLVGMPGV